MECLISGLISPDDEFTYNEVLGKCLKCNKNWKETDWRERSQREGRPTTIKENDKYDDTDEEHIDAWGKTIVPEHHESRRTCEDPETSDEKPSCGINIITKKTNKHQKRKRKDFMKKRHVT